MPETKYLWEGVPAGVPCWHIHHGALLEWSEEPLEERAKYIQRVKDAREVEHRLRLMRPVKSALPARVKARGDALFQADVRYRAAHKAVGSWHGDCQSHELFALRKAREKAYTDWDQAFNALDETSFAHRDEVNALHAAECPDCPWDGETIFPEEKP